MTGSDAALGDEAIDAELRPIILDQRARVVARGPLAAVTPPEMRERAAAEFRAWNQEPDAVADVRDLAVAGVPARLYTPGGSSDGLLVYCHGGGWVIGDLDLEDAALRRLANRSRVPILSLAYSLAPENPYPLALDEIERVIDSLADPAGPIPLPRRIGLGGASAGANLALGAALRLRDRGRRAPVFLLLLYGAYAGGAETGSYTAFADGRFGLPRAAMDWFWRAYTGGEPTSYSVPLGADLRGLPPVFLNHAELDILRDDSVLLAKRLRAAGVPVDARGYRGATHGFTQYAKGSALARLALDEAGDAVAAALG